MRLSNLKLASKNMTVDIHVTGHNSLRWAVLAIDTNKNLAQSLVKYSSQGLVFLTDSFRLINQESHILDLPKHTHIILWDGINSYLELVKHYPDTALREDFHYFVVGSINGCFVDKKVNIQPLYSSEVLEESKTWNKLLKVNQSFNASYHYRALTTFLTFTRYFKNWVADSERHKELSRGGKIVFCGLLTPSQHQLDSFFIGTNLPNLFQACCKLLQISYLDGNQTIDKVLHEIINTIKQEKVSEVSDLACIYSVLNILHRIKTIAFLHTNNADLFINETRSGARIDPYDSFFYKKNLYLDFGSTRGPDAIYPRTLDMIMTDKQFISLRYLPNNQTLPFYLESLSVESFSKTAYDHSFDVLREHNVFTNNRLNVNA